MQFFKIDKGVKVPPPAAGRAGTAPSKVALTIAKLSKGDSFLIAGELEALKAVKVVRDFNGRERERKGGRALVTRKAGKGMRVWRIK